MPKSKEKRRIQLLKATSSVARRLQRNKAKVAIARELCGFIWALLRAQDCYKQPVSAS